MNDETHSLVYPEQSKQLMNENECFHATGGVSQGNEHYNFLPAFLDFESGIIYISSFSNGEPAPIHLYDGLPNELVVSRNAIKKPIEIKQSVVSGFVLKGCFYTREQAVNYVSNSDKTDIV